MAANRAFRFAGSGFATPELAGFQEQARRAEGLGYDTFLIPDHFEERWFPIGPGLVAVACATTTLRVGSILYSNNFRHPALLAREAAAIDVLSGGRLEFGIGAGYYLPEYDQTGIPLPDPRSRVDRLGEALAIVKGLWGPDPYTFAGRHYTITAMEGWPKPVQQPRPPI